MADFDLFEKVMQAVGEIAPEETRELWRIDVDMKL